MRFSPAYMEYLISPRMRALPRKMWSWAEEYGDDPRTSVWVGAGVIAQVFREVRGAVRVSVNKTKHTPDETTASGVAWDEGLSWDELMSVKSSIGHARDWAVEVYPPDADVVNVANMRHLWILPEKPVYAWRKGPDGDAMAQPQEEETKP